MMLYFKTAEAQRAVMSEQGAVKVLCVLVDHFSRTDLFLHQHGSDIVHNIKAVCWNSAIVLRLPAKWEIHFLIILSNSTSYL